MVRRVAHRGQAKPNIRWAGTVLAGMVVAAGAVLPAGRAGAAAASSASFNWVMVTVQVPTAISELVVSIDFNGKRLHRGADAVGVATSAPRVDPDAAVYGQGFAGMNTQPQLTSTGGAGRLGLSMTQVPGPLLGNAGWQCFCGLRPGDVARYVAFETDAAWTTATVTVTGDGQALPADVRRGGGATAITVAEPDASGSAVALPVFATGSSSLARNLSSGVVGAVNGACATTCHGGWVAPDSRQGRTGDHPAFAGPGGRWVFDWSGTTNDPILAAWAPIGSAWRSFA